MIRRSAAVLHTLDNGLRVIVHENRSAPVVAIQVWVDAGSADEADDVAGIAHAMEHMVFKGTARRGVGRIAREIEAAGGDINAWTSFDQTVFHVVVASRFFSRGLDVLADSVLAPRIDAGELATELKVILEEIKEGDDAPGRVVSQDLFRTAYRKHPYRRPVIGHATAVKALTRPRIERFFRRMYAPSNMTLVVVGDVAAAQALTRVRRLFDKGDRRPRPRIKRAAEPRQRKLRVHVRHRPVKEAQIALGFHTPGIGHAAAPSLDLAAVILGQGDASRLVRRVKHELQLVTDIYAYAYTPADPGLLIVGASLPPEKIAAATHAITREIFSLAHEPVGDGELTRARTIVESDAVYQQETVQGYARKLGFYESVARDPSFDERYNRQIAEATPADVLAHAKRYLAVGNLSVAVLGPKETTAPRLAIEEAAQQAAAQARTSATAGAAKAVATARKITRVKLANGARLLVLSDPSVPLVAVRAAWLGGLRRESTRNNGINNLLAGAITRGTSARTADELYGEIEAMAGSFAGFSGRNSFGLHLELLARHWERGLDIFADCVRNPAFADGEVSRLQREILEDIRAQDDNVAGLAMQGFTRARYRKHPYRLDPVGTARSVAGLRRDQLARYFARNYPVGRMVLAVVGDVDASRVIARFRQLFGSSPRAAARPIRLAAEPPIREPRQATGHVDKKQAHLVVGYPGTTLRHRDRFALSVLTTLLSGQSGRLFVELREKQGLAYNVSAFSLEGIEPGYVAAYVATSPENVAAALAGIDAQVRRLRDERVSATDVGRAQRYLVGHHEISLQRKSTVAAFIAFNELYGLGHDAHERHAAGLLAVTPADVQRVARRYLDDRRKVVSIIQPREPLPAAARRFAQPRRAGVVKEGAPQRKSRRRRRR